MREYVFDVTVTKQMRVGIFAPDTPEGRIEAEKEAVIEAGCMADVVSSTVVPVDACSGEQVRRAKCAHFALVSGERCSACGTLIRRDHAGEEI